MDRQAKVRPVPRRSHRGLNAHPGWETRRLIEPTTDAAGVWGRGVVCPGSSTGCIEAGLRGVRETLNNALVQAQVLFGSSDGQSAVKAFAYSQVELAGVGALRQRLGDILAVRRKVSHRIGDEIDEPCNAAACDSASHDNQGNSAQVATNSSSSTDHVTR